MASKRCDAMKEVMKMMTIEIEPQMVKAYQNSMMKNTPALEAHPEVSDITGAVMRHLAARTRRLATA